MRVRVYDNGVLVIGTSSINKARKRLVKEGICTDREEARVLPCRPTVTSDSKPCVMFYWEVGP